MDLNIQIVTPSDFIKSSPTGELDIVSSKRILSEVAATSRGDKPRPILVDLRMTTSILNTVDLFELGSGLLEYGTAFRQKTAILTRNDDSFERAGFFELVASNRGYHIKAFTNFEEAVMWLVNIKDNYVDELR